MPLWPHSPNWREPYSVTYEFRTDIFTSRSGKEQRRALRTTPRKQVKFLVTRTGDQARQVNRFLTTHQGPLITLPDLTRHVRISSGTTTSLAVDGETPDWLKPGASVVLAAPGRDASYTLSTLQGINGNTLVLTEALDRVWPAGTKLHPPLSGKLEENVTVQSHGDRTTETSVAFSVDPGSTGAWDTMGYPTDVFNHREVFIAFPNFANAVPGEFKRPTDVVDFSRGRVSTFLPVGFSTRAKQYQLLAPSQQQRAGLLGLFLRMKGQRGEFYMSSYEDDFSLVVPVAASDQTATFSGTDLHDVFQADEVHRAIVIRTADRRLFYRTIIDSTSDGSNTTLTTDAGWPVELDDSTTINWLLVHRFATDQLSIDSVTDEIATVQFSVVSLEDRPVADPDAIYTEAELDGAALWIIKNWGKLFFEQRIYGQLDFAVNYGYSYIANTVGLRAIDAGLTGLGKVIARFDTITHEVFQ